MPHFAISTGNKIVIIEIMGLPSRSLKEETRNLKESLQICDKGHNKGSAG